MIAYATHANGNSISEMGEEPPAPDSESVEAFLTDLGRTVYGGGGITPDVLIEPPQASSFVQFLLSRNAYFEFAVEWANDHKVENDDWEPGPEILEEFSHWLSEKSLLTPDEIAKGLADPENTELSLRRIHADIFNSAFGLEARHRILSGADPQIQQALSLFGEASELLARRQQLEDGAPTAPASVVGATH